MTHGLKIQAKSLHVWEKLSEGDMHVDYKRKYESFRQKNTNSTVPFKTIGIYVTAWAKNLAKKLWVWGPTNSP